MRGRRCASARSQRQTCAQASAPWAAVRAGSGARAAARAGSGVAGARRRLCTSAHSQCHTRVLAVPHTRALGINRTVRIALPDSFKKSVL